VTLKTQIKKLNHYDIEPRSAFERIGALVLVGATVLSMVEASHDAAKQVARRDIVVGSNFLASPAPAEKNEMVRSPIKFDDGLRAVATTGA
jgi:hypothetical protein